MDGINDFVNRNSAAGGEGAAPGNSVGADFSGKPPSQGPSSADGWHDERVRRMAWDNSAEFNRHWSSRRRVKMGEPLDGERGAGDRGGPEVVFAEVVREDEPPGSQWEQPRSFDVSEPAGDEAILSVHYVVERPVGANPFEDDWTPPARPQGQGLLEVILDSWHEYMHSDFPAMRRFTLVMAFLLVMSSSNPTRWSFPYALYLMGILAASFVVFLVVRWYRPDLNRGFGMHTLYSAAVYSVACYLAAALIYEVRRPLLFIPIFFCIGIWFFLGES